MSDIETLRVLLVEDDPEYAALVQAVLAAGVQPCFELTHVTGLGAALTRVAEGGIDAVLLDLTLPDSAGVDTFTRMNSAAPGIPVVVLTASDDPTLITRLLGLGVQNYLKKAEMRPAVLRGVLQCAVKQNRMLGEIRAEYEQVSALLFAIRNGQVDSIVGNGGVSKMLHVEASEIHAENKRLMQELSRTNDRLRLEAAERRRVKELLQENVVTLKSANEALAQKNAELDEFSYVASHDLQEPLRKLTSFSKLLRMDIGGDLADAAAKDLDFITDAAQRMQTLVQDLLRLSRAGRSAIEHERVSLRDCVDRAIEALATRIAETGAKISRVELPEVTGDAALLTQLYQNLIGNALKFTAPDRNPTVRLTAQRTDQEWILGVCDNGIGIKPEYAGQVFIPFKRLHGRGEYEGSGIGLAICRKAVERHGGRIWVESQPGAGAHFKFTIGRQVETATCES